MLSVRLLPKTDPNLTQCAERTNAFTACSSLGMITLAALEFPIWHYERRGQCQIPLRKSTHLPAQTVSTQTINVPTSRPSDS